MNDYHEDFQQSFFGDYNDYDQDDVINCLRERNEDSYPFDLGDSNPYELGDFELSDDGSFIEQPSPLFFPEIEKKKEMPKRSPSPPPAPKTHLRRPPPPSNTSRNVPKKVTNKRSTKATSNNNNNNDLVGKKRKRENEKKELSADEKEELRKLKNRESARASRQRRKKYIQDLESKSQNLGTQNTKLWKSNQTLLSQNQQLREVIRIITAQKFGQQYQNFQQHSSQTQQQQQPPQEQTTTNSPVSEQIMSSEPARKKRKVAHEDSKKSNIPYFSMNPLSPQFWVSQNQSFANHPGRKVMFITLIFAFFVFSFYWTILPFQGREDYLLKKYLSSSERESSNLLITDRLEDIGRELLLLGDPTEEELNENVMREKVFSLIGDLGRKLYSLIEEEERKGGDIMSKYIQISRSETDDIVLKFHLGNGEGDIEENEDNVVYNGLFSEFFKEFC